MSINKKISRIILDIKTSFFITSVFTFRKIATTNKDIAFTKDKDFCSQECEVGELITSVLLGAFPNVDAVMLNSGGIRSSFAKGDILYAENVLQKNGKRNAFNLIKIYDNLGTTVAEATFVSVKL